VSVSLLAIRDLAAGFAVVAVVASAATLGLALRLAPRRGMGRPLGFALRLRSRLALDLSLRSRHTARLGPWWRRALHARLTLHASLRRGARRGTLDRAHERARRPILTRAIATRHGCRCRVARHARRHPVITVGRPAELRARAPGLGVRVGRP
jgi:hypothetical protein